MYDFNKELRTAARLLTTVVVALAAAACGSSKTTTTDGGPDTAGDTGAAADTGGVDLAMTSCDPFAQNCATGQKCDFFCQGSMAVVACETDSGGGAIGAACAASMPCAKGGGCIATPTSGGSFCLKYCTGDGDCATGQRCHNDTVGLTCTGGTTSFLLHFCHN